MYMPVSIPLSGNLQGGSKKVDRFQIDSAPMFVFISLYHVIHFLFRFPCRHLTAVESLKLIAAEPSHDVTGKFLCSHAHFLWLNYILP